MLSLTLTDSAIIYSNEENSFTTSSVSAVQLEVLNSSLTVETNSTYKIIYRFTETGGDNITFKSISIKFKAINSDAFINYSIHDTCTIKLNQSTIVDWSFKLNITDALVLKASQNGLNKIILDTEFSGLNQMYEIVRVSCLLDIEISQNVAIIVDDSIYSQIETKLLQYTIDICSKFAIDFTVYNGTWITPEDLRDFISDVWINDNISGAILCGYLPYALWKMPNEEVLPIPLFYEDLDGSFNDTDFDNIYDYHEWGSNDGPEIWVSLFMPPRNLIEPYYLDAYGDQTVMGLVGEYYNNKDFTSLYTTKIDPIIEFYWSEGTLPSGVYPDTFSIRWTGKILAETSENYTFSPFFGGGLRLWIDDNILINISNPPYKWREYTNTTYLTAGWHDIKIEYIEGGWGLDYNGSVRLCWTSPSILASALIDYFDKTHLYHTDQLDYLRKALLYMDYEYGDKSNMLEPTLEKLSSIYGENVVVGGATEFANAEEYLDFLDNGHEITSIWSHADPTAHQFIPPPESEQSFSAATSWLIRRYKSSLVTLIWGCEAGDFSAEPYSRELTDNLAVTYAFGTENGLASVACTRSFGTTFREVYYSWANQSYLGLGFFAYLDNKYNYSERLVLDPTKANNWVVDGILLGDPFIEIKPLPSGLSLSINEDSGYTNDRNITLHLNSINAEEMCFQEDDNSWSSWEGYSISKNWMLTGTEGIRTIKFKTRNSNGESLNIASSSVILDETKPNFVNAEWNAESKIMIWEFSDITPNYYSIFINGTEQFSDDWTGGPIIIDFSNLEYGIHNLSIIVYDELEYHTHNSIIIEIIEPTTPTPTPTETSQAGTIFTLIALTSLLLVNHRKKRKAKP
jgi:hypothetical protein